VKTTGGASFIYLGRVGATHYRVYFSGAAASNYLAGETEFPPSAGNGTRPPPPTRTAGEFPNSASRLAVSSPRDLVALAFPLSAPAACPNPSPCSLEHRRVHLSRLPA